MDKRLLAPIGLVEVEGPFLGFAVKVTQVPFWFSPCLPPSSRDHRRQKSSTYSHVWVAQPQAVKLPYARGEDFLLASGDRPLLRGARLVSRVGVRAVLTETDAAVGVLGVAFVKENHRSWSRSPRCQRNRGCGAVHIGEFQNRAGDFQHKDVCHRGRRGRVEVGGPARSRRGGSPSLAPHSRRWRRSR